MTGANSVQTTPFGSDTGDPGDPQDTGAASSATLTLPAGLIEHIILRTPQLPACEGPLYRYILAGNGVFIQGKREGLRACIPVKQCEVRGLPNCEACIEFLYPKAPCEAVELMLRLSREAASEKGRATETLFHLGYADADANVSAGAGAEWRLAVPEQEATATSVKPLISGPDSSYARAIIEVHSHHNMPAFWSSDDDRDEQGFRLYGVLGDIYKQPTLRLRVGLYGYFYELDPALIFELPGEVARSGHGLRREQEPRVKQEESTWK